MLHISNNLVNLILIETKTQPEHKETIHRNPFLPPPSQISRTQPWLLHSSKVIQNIWFQNSSGHSVTENNCTHHKLTVSQHNLLVGFLSLERGSSKWNTTRTEKGSLTKDGNLKKSENGELRWRKRWQKSENVISQKPWGSWPDRSYSLLGSRSDLPPPRFQMS